MAVHIVLPLQMGGARLVCRTGPSAALRSVRSVRRCYSSLDSSSSAPSSSSSWKSDTQTMAAASAAAATSSPTIPIIDFAPFLQSSSPSDGAARCEVSSKVVEAFKTSGFIYLKNHGLAPSQIKEVFAASKRFFELPMPIKDRLAWKDPRANRGYVTQGRERVTNKTDAKDIAELRETAPDFKESLEIGREVDETWKNHWPEEDELPGFRRTMLDFRVKADKLHLEVLRSIAIGLDLPNDFFDEKCHQEWHTLRLLHYPSVPTSVLKKGQGSRAGAHSDYGTLTLLFQDNVGGLEVEDPHTGEYVAAPPIPDTIVINVGDLLARWSNDTLRSTLHRVLAPKGIADTGMTPARYSIAYFMNPNEHQMVQALPSCVSEKQPAKYKPVVTADYLAQRLSETYS